MKQIQQLDQTLNGGEGDGVEIKTVLYESIQQHQNSHLTHLYIFVVINHYNNMKCCGIDNYNIDIYVPSAYFSLPTYLSIYRPIYLSV